jgi:hypothetical protein
VGEAVDGQESVIAQEDVVAEALSAHRRPVAEHTTRGIRPCILVCLRAKCSARYTGRNELSFRSERAGTGAGSIR